MVIYLRETIYKDACHKHVVHIFQSYTCPFLVLSIHRFLCRYQWYFCAFAVVPFILIYYLGVVMHFKISFSVRAFRGDRG